MGLIVYIPQADVPGQQLQEMIGHLIWEDTIEIFYTLKRLFFRLRHPNGNEDIALLLASTPRDLNDLVTNSHLLNNLRIVMILPDRDEETIAKGHLLRPRFVSYRDNDFSSLSLVLKKMKKTACPQPHSDTHEVLTQRGGV